VLKTKKGEAVFIKMDIFKRVLWYTYKEDRNKWFKLTLENVKEIIDLNKNNKPVTSLEDYEFELLVENVVTFEDVVGQDSLTRFDAPKRKNTHKSKNKSKNLKPPVQATQATQPTQTKQAGGGGNSKNRKQRPPNRSANPNKNS
jgi:hypothetical protein